MNEKLDHGQSIEYINGIRTWVAFKRKWYYNAFGTGLDFTGIDSRTLDLAIIKDCKRVRMNLINKSNRIIEIRECNIDMFNGPLAVRHPLQDGSDYTVNVPVLRMDKIA